MLFTSGQHLAPMASGPPHAISKGAIDQMTLSLADAVSYRGITVNAINPGPVDSGWPAPSLSGHWNRRFPLVVGDDLGTSRRGPLARVCRERMDDGAGA